MLLTWKQVIVMTKAFRSVAVKSWKDEVDSSGKQSTVRDREVVDLKGHNRTFAEELVVLVLQAVVAAPGSSFDPCRS